tara:strand:- start:128 stop:427 length:300 start_codon:yes stop_codon:yes gene_type:complete
MTENQTIDKPDITKLKAPNKYHVIMLNDDTTPMDFVISIIVQVFNKQVEEAKEIMIEIHNKGREVVGSYSFEVAEQKCVETTTIARRNNYPLEVTIEES